MVNQYRYTLTTTTFGDRLVNPLNEAGLTETYNLIDGNIADYKHELSGTLLLVAEDFQWLYQIETSSFRCAGVGIIVEKKCSGVWSDYLIGKINLSSCKWIPEKCIVEIKIETDDPYSCFSSKKDLEIDLFVALVHNRVVNLFHPDSILEYTTCTTTAIPIAYQYWCNGGRPSDAGWMLWKHTFTSSSPGTGTNTTYWVREKRIQDCALSLADPWIFISEFCPGSGKTYVRRPVVYNPTTVESRDGVGNLTNYLLTFKIFGRPEDGPSTIDNGMRLQDALIHVASLCSLTVKSNFFQINADAPSADNYVTGLLSKVLDIIIFQKSDVKRPSAINNATLCKIKLESFLNGICIFFNLKWKVQGGFFRIEHISYFSQTIGIDLTAQKFAKYVRFKNSYSYDQQKLPRQEKFKTQEHSISSDFEGRPIIYDNECTQSGVGGTTEYAVDSITTDLLHVLNNPQSDSSRVSDAGIVLIATENIADQLYLLNEGGILFAEPYPNNSLAWSQLLRDYYRFRRPFKTGNKNGVNNEFISVSHTIKGEELAVPICCDDVFNPVDFMKTALGNGMVESYAKSLRDNIAKIQLLYEPQPPSIVNSEPIAVEDGFTLNKNQTIDFDVLANDVDADGIGTIIEVEIITDPSFGVASVVDKKIRFTPNANYVGYDALYYRIKDNYNIWSNAAVVIITVIDPGPTAVPDTFTVKKNQVKNFVAPGPMVNDTPGAGVSIFVVTNQAVSALGVSISINADGSFTYNAPNLVATDTFTYTIRNDQNLESTALITINIIDAPPSTQFVFSRSNYNGANACFMYTQPPTRQNWFSDSAVLSLGSVLYSDDLYINFAPIGFYSDGVKVYTISGSVGVISNISNC